MRVWRRLGYAGWLALRLVGVGRGGGALAASTVLAAALAVVTVVGLVAALGVVRAQAGRLERRTPLVEAVYGEEVVAGAPLVAYREVVLPAGVVYVFTVAARGGGGPVPPGLERLPGPGEAFVSPALAGLWERGGLARALLAGPPEGLVGAAGLRAPDDLVAWVGVDAGALARAGVPYLTGFGGRQHVSELLQPGYVVFYGAAVVVFVLVPLGVVAATAARLSARLRERRLAALRAVGFTPVRAAAVAVVETGALAAGGGVLGVVALPLLRSLVGSGPVAGVRFFAADVRVPVGLAVAAAVGVTLWCVLVAGAAAGRVVRRGLLLRPTLDVVELRGRSLLLLGAAVAALLVLPMVWRALPPIALALLFYAAVSAAAVGVAAGLPALVQRGARVLAPRQPGVAGLLALRRLAANPGAPARLAAPVCALVLAVAAFAPLLGRLEGDAAWQARWEGLREAGGRQLVQVESVAEDVDLSPVAALDGTQALLPIITAHDPETGEERGGVLLATCGDVAIIAEPAPSRCLNRPFRLRLPDSLEHDLEGPIAVPTRHGSSVALPRVPELVVDVPGGDAAAYFVDGLVVVDPQWLDSRLDEPGRAAVAPAAGYLVVLDTTAEAVTSLHATLVHVAPTAVIRDTYGAALAADARYQPWVRFLLALMTLGGVLAAVALLIAGLQVANERGAELRPLHVAGTPEATLRRSQWLVVALPSVVGSVIATLVGLLAGYTWWSWQRGPVQHVGTVLRVTAVALAVAATVAWMTSRRLGRVLAGPRHR